MSTLSPDDLLKQALDLVKKDPRRPKQANLRRGVSAAYYALFHLLVLDGANVLCASDPTLAKLVARSFSHQEMAKTCGTFASNGSLPAAVALLYPSATVPQDLKDVAQAFVDLQKSRHDADYGTHRLWARTEALTEVERAKQAFKLWKQVRPRPTSPKGNIARLFLASMLLRPRG